MACERSMLEVLTVVVESGRRVCLDAFAMADKKAVDRSILLYNRFGCGSGCSAAYILGGHLRAEQLESY